MKAVIDEITEINAKMKVNEDRRAAYQVEMSKCQEFVTKAYIEINTFTLRMAEVKDQSELKYLKECQEEMKRGRDCIDVHWRNLELLWQSMYEEWKSLHAFKMKLREELNGKI